jgi:transposase
MMKKGKREAPGRRAFSAEFKLEAVQLMQAQRAQGISLSEIGRQVGVRPDQLRSWARRLAKQAGVPPLDVFPGHGKLPTAEDEVRRLQREVAILRQERDFLKKATAFFARESR